MLRFAGAIHDAAHHGNLELLDPTIALLPNRHLLSQIVLNLIRHVLEKHAGGAPAAWTSSHLRHEAANSERLEDLLGDSNFLGAISVWKWRERDANGIANAFLQQD